MRKVWTAVAPGVRTFTAAAGFPMSLSFVNSTTYTRLQVCVHPRGLLVRSCRMWLPLEPLYRPVGLRGHAVK